MKQAQSSTRSPQRKRTSPKRTGGGPNAKPARRTGASAPRTPKPRRRAKSEPTFGARRWWWWAVGTLALLFFCGLALPEEPLIPVKNAAAKDWNRTSFWHEPWGPSGVHKGVDIFAPQGTPVLAPTGGVVVYRGQFSLGGNVLLVLGPKWRLHYFAHLNRSYVGIGTPVARGREMAEVGNTGNAAGKPPHLHYAIISLLPLPWRWDGATQGWKKMFYLNPHEWLLRQPD